MADVNKWVGLKSHDISKIVKLDFPEDQYYKEETPKIQIVLHHTVSGAGIQGDLNTWLSDKSRIATCVIIERNGIVNQCFSSKYWAPHLGVKSDFLQSKGFSDADTRNRILDKGSISIEIDSWGQLTKVGDNQYKTCYGNIVSNIDVVEYPNKFRDSVYYEKYSDAQLKSLGEMLILWNKKYNIPLTYNKDMWDVNKQALSGKTGVWTHVSFRQDKSDCHPDTNLISMLKSLTLE